MEIYITRNEEHFGPYSEADVRQYLVTGDLSPNDLAWHEGQPEWLPLKDLMRTASVGPSLPKVPPPPPAPSRLPKLRYRRYALIGGVGLFVLYLVSPYFSLWRLRSALESGDRDNLEARIDFPSVRESLKDQIRTQMTKSMAKDKDLKDNPFGGLATALAPMMVNYAVDNFVTPSGISALIADSKSALKESGAPDAEHDTKKSIDWSKVHYAFFTSPAQFTVDMDGTKLRFRFTGFGWQLKRIEIPDDAI